MPQMFIHIVLRSNLPVWVTNCVFYNLKQMYSRTLIIGNNGAGHVSDNRNFQKSKVMLILVFMSKNVPTYFKNENMLYVLFKCNKY